MAVTTTPLGFKKPDGNELVRGGDNHIADNAQKAEDLIAGDRGRLGSIEALNVTQNGRLTAAESGITSAASRVTALESGNVTRDSRLTAAESATAAQSTRLTGLEYSDTAQDAHLAQVDSKYATFSARIGQAEANIAAGSGGGGLGLSEDPDNPGTYFMADTTPTGPLQADPVTPGLYTF